MTSIYEMAGKAVDLSQILSVELLGKPLGKRATLRIRLLHGREYHYDTQGRVIRVEQPTITLRYSIYASAHDAYERMLKRWSTYKADCERRELIKAVESEIRL